MDAGGVPSVVDVRQWRRIASLGSGRTGSVSLCEGEPIGTSSSPSSGATTYILRIFQVALIVFN